MVQGSSMSMVCVLEFLYGSQAKDCLKVEFRLVVFRPFKDEVLLGRISSAKEDGIRSKSIFFHQSLSLLTVAVRTQFFDEIFVPADKLPEGSHL